MNGKKVTAALDHMRLETAGGFYGTAELVPAV